jgi:uncharacterized membrane protein YkoI
MNAKWFLTAVLAAGLCGCGMMDKDHHANSERHEEGDQEEAGEVKMSLSEVPAAVRDGLQKAAGGSKIDKVDKMQVNGKTIYETDVMKDGKEWEIQVDESGNVVSNKMEGKEEDDEKK